MRDRRRRPHLLIAARHPSAGGGAAALAAVAQHRGVGVEILASGAALTGLTARGLRGVLSFATARQRYPELPAYRGPERIENDTWRQPLRARRQVEQMVEWLHRYLLVSRPAAVVLTDANEQLGADQLLAVAATRAGIPSVRVRDAWGTAAGIENRGWERRIPAPLRREALATCYLEIDAHGVEMSARRLGIPRNRLRAVDGLFTLDRLVGRATSARWARTRRHFGIGDADRLVMFFAQPTRRERAEEEALDAVIAAMNSAGFGKKGVTLATQEHPREADPVDGRFGHNWAAARAVARYEGRVINLTPSVFQQRAVSFEDTLVAADVVASSYSYSSVEATMLGATGDRMRPFQRSIGVHILPSGVRRRMKLTRRGMSITPFAAQGAMPHASRLSEIAPLLTRLLFRPASRESYFRVLRRQWHPGRSAERVIDEVLDVVRREARETA